MNQLLILSSSTYRVSLIAATSNRKRCVAGSAHTEASRPLSPVNRSQSWQVAEFPPRRKKDNTLESPRPG